jgi:hypothetical protein
LYQKLIKATGNIDTKNLSGECQIV